MLRANALLKANIDALLRARHQTRKDLATWCRRGESWISKVMKEDRREFPLKYLDRIADFFGIAAYQLLQPGITPLLERRKIARRSGVDRRISHATAMLRDPALDNQELIRLVLSADQEEKRAVYASLLEARVGPSVRPKPEGDEPGAPSNMGGARRVPTSRRSRASRAV